ncbi:hypothetical protein BVER_01597c [Candidatus Burkholderia verschuerenii]|uniref:Uncharacterized protein n=1 Tax=Candidatus Burkholderia verschuerenii TaxID=242163 RepID=A0A0L0MK47_9BURK|nr:hypothetical protein [Candidatus Burkholderia verschuerenii]KND62394.1 hypothetical protein BVER_01597c [Candidatus Burkholderia verschuerenii]
MPDDSAQWRVFDYEGFEIHVLPQLKATPEHAAPRDSDRYVYIGHVCRHGANAREPGEAVHFHADGDDAFKREEDAVDEARHIGRAIIDGTHPDLSVLPIVSHHHHPG